MKTQVKIALTALMTLVLGALTLGLLVPNVGELGYPVKAVALTIDDGPDPRFTPSVLHDLQRYEDKATFFFLGENVEKHPDLAKKVLAAGHEVGNHTMSHLHMEQATFERNLAEIQGANEMLESMLGVTPTFFRPPRGHLNHAAMQAIRASGMTPAFWTLALEHHGLNPQEMVDRVMRYVHPGAVILMHDGNLDRTLSVKALPILLKELHDEGYQVVSLGELEQYHPLPQWRKKYLCEPSCPERINY